MLAVGVMVLMDMCIGVPLIIAVHVTLVTADTLRLNVHESKNITTNNDSNVH